MVNINEERCVMCGESIPEGRMVCNTCEDMEMSFNTIKFRINLNKIVDIFCFVKLASKCKCDVVLKSGNFAINAKSIMGVYTLDLSNPVTVEIYDRIPKRILQEMKKFAIE